jgi:hypothetical protein
MVVFLTLFDFPFVHFQEGHNYPAGVAFSPDAMMMYVSLYNEAIYQISRVDGMSFLDAPASIVYDSESSVPAPAPTTGGAPTSGANPSPAPSSDSVGGNDWNMAMIMLACVVAVAVPAFAMS